MAPQIEWLQKSPRRKIVIPDRTPDGIIMANQAIELNWGVSCPDIGTCKDINEAVIKYGSLYVLASVRDSIYTGFEAKTKTLIYCK
jgi:hypothetical protein